MLLIPTLQFIAVYAIYCFIGWELNLMMVNIFSAKYEALDVRDRVAVSSLIIILFPLVLVAFMVWGIFPFDHSLEHNNKE